MKINLDKYYTPKELAKFCTEKAVEVIGRQNITEVIEPSIGNGAFITDVIDIDIGIDLEPNIYNTKINIICDDFLNYNIEYKKGRLIIGNPPYGRCLNMAQKFYEKSTQIADYIGFILPISQLNNTNSMYKFDLILSLDLGMEIYTDRELHCCFNVYRRPEQGLNTKKNNQIKKYKNNKTR